MIDLAHNKIGNLNTGLKGNIARAIPKKTNSKKYLEHFLEESLIGMAIKIIIFNSTTFIYRRFTFNMGGHRAQNNQAQNGSNMIYFLNLLFVIYIFPLFFSKDPNLFSTSQSSTYRFALKTSTFQTPYFVRE